MSIIFLGDIHGEISIFNNIAPHLNEDDIIIQVGDFGFYPDVIDKWKSPGIPVYAIDGNHEDHTWIRSWAHNDVTEVADNLFYIKRGSVLNFNNITMGFCGGGTSIDKYIRLDSGNHYDELEEVTYDDINRLFNIKLDMLITHTPPIEVIRAGWPPLEKKLWGLPNDWTDTSSSQIQLLWEHHDRMPLVCGHMHMDFYYNLVHVLDINQTMELV